MCVVVMKVFFSAEMNINKAVCVMEISSSYIVFAGCDVIICNGLIVRCKRTKYNA